MKYEKPLIELLGGEVYFTAEAQYFLNITEENCPGMTCTFGDRQVELEEGVGFIVEDCMQSNPFHVGSQLQVKCEETGDAEYLVTVIDIDDGSIDCPDGHSAFVITYSASTPLSGDCTISYAYLDEYGFDLCHIECSE